MRFRIRKKTKKKYNGDSIVRYTIQRKRWGFYWETATVGDIRGITYKGDIVFSTYDLAIQGIEEWKAKLADRVKYTSITTIEFNEDK